MRISGTAPINKRRINKMKKKSKSKSKRSGKAKPGMKVQYKCDEKKKKGEPKMCKVKKFTGKKQKGWKVGEI